jgi:SET domain-containing protein
VRKVSEAVGFGVFANQRIPKGTFLGNYVGEVIPYDAVGNNNYLFGMVPEVEDFHSGLVVDAHKYGNHTRFINHSSRPNVKAYTIELDRRAETYFEALRDIESGEQLLFDYGPDYWVGKLSPEAA